MSGSTDSETHDRTTPDRETRDSEVRDPADPDAGTPDPADSGAGDPSPADRATAPDTDDSDASGDSDTSDASDDEGTGDQDPDAEDPDDDDQDPEARRARWTAVGTGALLTLAGLAASVLRTSVSGTALIPLSYASGAVLCAGASALGARGRTRRALWLMIAGVMVMAVGDQLD
ncbi:hypothetical protein [Streptomyces sp. NPDC127038]|uniref:hypothetical protein n=1 Tax=Streptomyces sp. NPDC127038 TaxID=3347114 RepID=UPI00365E4A59